ncbi:MAG: LCP family protein, partial [Anaerolineales bacterium]
MNKSSSLSATQPNRTVSWAPPPPPNRKRQGCCIVILLLPLLLVGCLIASLYLIGGRTNVVILGLDTREPGSDLGRSDTIILTTFAPRQPYLGMLSIPRDLWVSIPDYGENRINTAHFFA